MLQLVSGLLYSIVLFLFIFNLLFELLLLVCFLLLVAFLESAAHRSNSRELVCGAHLDLLLADGLDLGLFQLLEVLLGRLLPIHNKILVLHF